MPKSHLNVVIASRLNAVQHRELALQRYRAHDPGSEFLFAPEYVQPGENGANEIPGNVSMARIRKKHWLTEESVGDAIVEQEHLFDL